MFGVGLGRLGSTFAGGLGGLTLFDFQWLLLLLLLILECFPQLKRDFAALLRKRLFSGRRRLGRRRKHVRRRLGKLAMLDFH